MEIKNPILNIRQIFKKNYGFTLLETLITILLFGVLGTVATVSLFTFLKGAANTEVTKELKQNGDYAMSVMEVTIRNATSITSLANCSDIGTYANFITVTNPDATATTFTCSSSRIQRGSDYLTNSSVSVSSTTCSNMFFCRSVLGVPNEVIINFQLDQASTTDPLNQQTFQTKVGIRNKNY